MNDNVINDHIKKEYEWKQKITKIAKELSIGLDCAHEQKLLQLLELNMEFAHWMYRTGKEIGTNETMILYTRRSYD